MATEKIEDTQPGKKTDSTLPPLPAGKPVKPARSGLGRPPDYWLLWLVALGSLALNVWLLNTLLTIRRQIDDARVQAAKGLTDAANGVGQMSLGAFDYNVEVNDSIPIDIKVPISDTFLVPVSQTLHINDAAVVNLPLIGRTTIPFSVAVPIDLTVTFPISRTYRVVDKVPVHFIVPVHIDLDQTPLGNLKGEIQASLLDAAKQLQQPPAP